MAESDIPISRGDAVLAVSDLLQEEGLDAPPPLNGASFMGEVDTPPPAAPEAPQETPAEGVKPLTPEQREKLGAGQNAPQDQPFEVPRPDPVPAHLAGHEQEVISQLGLLQQEAAYAAQLPPHQRVAAEQRIRQKAAQVAQYGQQVQVALGRHGQQARQGQMDRLRKETMRQIPEWNESAVAKREIGQIRSWMHDRGYSDREINSLNDPRAVRDLRGLWLAEQGVRNPVRRSRQYSARNRLDVATKKAKASMEKKGYSQTSQLEAVQKLLRSL